MYQQEHHFLIICVNLVRRSAKMKAAVRLKTWNGVLSTMAKNHDCSYLQRHRLSSAERSYSQRNCRT